MLGGANGTSEAAPRTVIIQRLRDQAAARPRRVLLPEVEDPRVVEAAHELASQGLATPVSPDTLKDDPKASDWEARIDLAIINAFEKKGGDAVAAARTDPLLRIAFGLREGRYDAVVMGSVATTADVLRAGIKGVGLAEGANLVSSCFLMELPERVMTFGDCAVVPEPDAGQLAQIAIDSAKTHAALTGEEPRVAMLSFSTRGSASHASVDKVREAVALVRERDPNLQVDGEIQFDAAFDAGVGEKKAPGSEVAGQANVFVFPSLEAGNIGYKIAERMGGANAIGPVLQGLSRPWMDLSRGCKAADIVNLAVIASLLAA